jgi:hypothetical protein
MQGDLWHSEVITAAVERTLRDLYRASLLAGFYLAGGTGLALRLGHRRSVDLDFFSAEAFDQERLLQKVQQLSGFSLLRKDEQTLHVNIAGTRVTFLGYTYPVLFPFQSFSGVKVADPRDIACMKISAIAGRGARRDFVDLYAASKPWGLSELLELFRHKFAQANYSLVHVLKSLTYFEDAEKDPMPDMLTPISWDEVTGFFSSEAPRLLEI